MEIFVGKFVVNFATTLPLLVLSGPQIPEVKLMVVTMVQAKDQERVCLHLVVFPIRSIVHS